MVLQEEKYPMKFTKMFKKWRIMLFFFVLIVSIIAINPQFDKEGVAIKHISSNSTAAFAGMQNPSPDTPLTAREKIIKVEETAINSPSDYHAALAQIPENTSLSIFTNRQEYIVLKENDLGITVDQVATSNLKKGLELQGGSRVLLQPEEEITEQERTELIAIMEQRLNTYGLSDITIKKADDLLGKKYIAVEIAGASKEEVKDLVASQGKFEAKIGEEVVFEGGKKDITFVCRNDGSCAGIRSCDKVNNGYQCIFEFQISLSGEAAKRHAVITDKVDINISTTGREYLAKPLDLLIDSRFVESLQIDAELKGREATSILISGPGIGVTEEEAMQDALKQMNKLQTVLLTGSLPVKLEIVKLDSISPGLGSAFAKNAFFTGIFAILAVSLVIFIRYRNLKVAIPVVFISLAEIIITLGFAAFIKWNLDLASIAGIIAAVGTGVNDQIVIVDEMLSGEQYYKWKDKIKRAFFIIMAAYATLVAAMLPLFKAGAGLLTGFALVTIIGVTVGVFITRPAFAAMIEVMLEE